MRIKSVFKYQFRDYKISYLMFFGILLFLEAANLVGIKLSGVEDKGIYFRNESMVVLAGFIMGANAFRENFQMLMQNNVSRKLIEAGRILNTLLSGIILAVLCRLVSLVYELAALGDSRMQARSVFGILYPSFWEQANGLEKLGVELLFWAGFVILFTMLGYFFGALYYNLGKVQKTLLSIGIPVFLLLVLPILDVYAAGGRIAKFFLGVLTLLLGGTAGNPAWSFFSTLIGAAIFGGIAVLIALRSPVQN